MLDRHSKIITMTLPKCGNSSVVEHNLAKVGVASSNLVSRSNVFVYLYGWVAEWSCSGLQSRGRRFDSDPSLQFQGDFHARVAEMVDARDLKSLEGNLMPVRLRPRAPVSYAVPTIVIPAKAGIHY